MLLSKFWNFILSLLDLLKNKLFWKKLPIINCGYNNFDFFFELFLHKTLHKISNFFTLGWMVQDVKFKIIDVGHVFHLLPCDTFWYTSRLLFGINTTIIFMWAPLPWLMNRWMKYVCVCTGCKVMAQEVSI